MCTQLGGMQTQLGEVQTQLGEVQTQLGEVQTRLGGIDARMENLLEGQRRIEDRLDMIATRQENSFAVFDDDVIVPPIFNGIDPPANLPRTVSALRNL